MPLLQRFADSKARVRPQLPTLRRRPLLQFHLALLTHRWRHNAGCKP